MRKSIASEYFSLCIALVTASLIVMSSVLVNFSVSTYKNDRRLYLSTASASVLVSTAAYLEKYGEEAADELNYLYTYRQTADSSEAFFYLFNSNGDVLAYSEASPCSHSGNRLSTDSMRASTADGFFSMGTLDGFFDESCLNFIYSVGVSGKTFYFVACTPIDGMNIYMTRMIIVFAVIFVLIMLIIYPILKYTLNRILNPIKEMTLAARRFGNGDFSEKVKVIDKNEMGFLANTLNEMASSLDAIEDDRKRFISNVSHELRTPMTTIGGFVDGILDGTIPPDKHREYLQIVSEEVNRLARLVRSMLNISKYEAGELMLQTENFDISSVTVKTVLMFEKRIDAKNVEIRGLDSERLFVNADCDLIQQVIYNLTENAVKFVNENGYIDFSFHTDGKMVFVNIRNSGEGLKKNEISKVFDRFYKTDESRGKDKTGVGLGLSIVRSIIKLHGGSVLVRSKQGEYTEFEFSVPAGSGYTGSV